MGYDMLARIGADISDFSRKMAMVQERLGEFGKFKGGLIGAGTLMAPSVIPMIAALAAGAGALGSAFVAAGAGAAVFGAVAVSNLGKIFEASKNAEAAQKKLDEATNAKERAAAMEELAAATAGFTDKQREAFDALNDFKSFWQGFAKEFENPTLDIFIGSLNTLEGILNLLKPAIAGTAHGFSYLLGLLNQSLNTEPMQQFFNFLGNNAESAIISLGIIFGDVLGGIMNLMVAFGSASMGMLDGLMNLTDGFYEWSKSVGQSEGFKQFMAYVSANAPVLMSLLGSIISIIKSLVIAFAPFGQAALAAMSGIAGFIAKLLEANPAIGTTIASIVAAVGAFMLLNPAVFAVIGVVGKIGLVMKMAGDSTTLLGRAIAFLSGPVGIAIGVILALVAIFTYLFNTNQQFHDQVMAIWTEIQAMFAAVLPSILSLVQVLASTFSQIASAILPILVQAIQSLLPIFQAVFMAVLQIVMAVLPIIIQLLMSIIPVVMQIVTAVLPLILQVVQQVFPMVLSIVQMVIPIVIQIIQMLVPIILQIAQQVLPAILQAAQAVFPLVLSIVQAAIPIVQSILNALAIIIQTVVIPAIQIILSAVQAVMPVVKSIIEGTIKTVSAIFQVFASLLRGDFSQAWDDFLNVIETVMDSVANVVETGWNAAQSFLESIDLAEIGRNIIQGLIDGVTSMAGGVLEAISSIGTGIQDTISGLMKINSPSKWMRDVIGGGIGEGLVKGIIGTKSDVMGTVAAMTKQMQQGWSNGLSNVQLGYDVSGAATVGSYTLPASANNKTQASAAASNNRPVVIENVIMMDSYEVARATSGHIDTMQGNKLSVQNYMRGDRG